MSERERERGERERERGERESISNSQMTLIYFQNKAVNKSFRIYRGVFGWTFWSSRRTSLFTQGSRVGDL